MLSKDYRVRLTVSFYVDVAAISPKDARHGAEYITREVFSQDYKRAQGVVIKAVNTKKLPDPPTEQGQ